MQIDVNLQQNHMRTIVIVALCLAAVLWISDYRTRGDLRDIRAGVAGAREYAERVESYQRDALVRIDRLSEGITYSTETVERVEGRVTRVEGRIAASEETIAGVEDRIRDDTNRLNLSQQGITKAEGILSAVRKRGKTKSQGP